MQDAHQSRKSRMRSDLSMVGGSVSTYDNAKVNSAIISSYPFQISKSPPIKTPYAYIGNCMSWLMGPARPRCLVLNYQQFWLETEAVLPYVHMYVAEGRLGSQASAHSAGLPTSFTHCSVSPFTLHRRPATLRDLARHQFWAWLLGRQICVSAGPSLRR